MQRYIASFLIVCMLILGNAGGLALAAQPQGVSERITAVEMELYGMEQSGAVLERVARLEYDLYNEAYSLPVVQRVDKVYNDVLGNAAGRGTFVSRLNAVEITFTKGIADKPAKVRLDDLEKTIIGDAYTGGMMARLQRLTTMAFPNGKTETEQVTLPQDTLIKISIQKELVGRVSRVGEEVPFRAEDNIFVGDALVIPKGAMGTAKIVKITEPALFGRDGRIDLEFKSLPAMDGSRVAIELGDIARKMTQSQIKAGGAAAAGMILLGPIGATGGLFIKGKVPKVPVGTMIYTQVKESVTVYGVKGVSVK